MWTVFIAETVTGKIVRTLDCLVQSWARELDGTDTLSVTLAPGAITVKNRDTIMPLLEPNRMSLVLDWDGTPIVWGVIKPWQWSSDTAQIDATGFRQAILAKRKIHSWAQPYASQVITYSNVSLGSIATQLGKVATDPAKPGSSLPIVFQSLESDTDPTHTRTYNGYELKTVDDGWTELTGVIGGPDIDLQPAYSDATRQYVFLNLRVGTMAQPMLYSPQVVTFDYGSPQSGVEDLTVIRDGSLQVTTEWALGNGSDVSTLMSKQDDLSLVNQGWPLLEGENDYTSTVVQSTLDSSAASDLATYRNPTRQWGLQLNALAQPKFGGYLVGDLCTVRVKDHPALSDNLNGYPMRMVAFNGDNSTKITISVQGQVT